MNRRVEFSLNMDNPSEAALYEALHDLLRHRRAGEVIRQALSAYLFNDPVGQPSRKLVSKTLVQSTRTNHESVATDEQTTSRIISQSAEMFGF